jgi:hypothetical protein
VGTEIFQKKFATHYFFIRLLLESSKNTKEGGEDGGYLRFFLKTALIFVGPLMHDLRAPIQAWGPKPLL